MHRILLIISLLTVGAINAQTVVNLSPTIQRDYPYALRKTTARYLRFASLVEHRHCNQVGIQYFQLDQTIVRRENQFLNAFNLEGIHIWSATIAENGFLVDRAIQIGDKLYCISETYAEQTNNFIFYYSVFNSKGELEKKVKYFNQKELNIPGHRDFIQNGTSKKQRSHWKYEFNQPTQLDDEGILVSNFLMWQGGGKQYVGIHAYDTKVEKSIGYFSFESLGLKMMRVTKHMQIERIGEGFLLSMTVHCCEAGNAERYKVSLDRDFKYVSHKIDLIQKPHVDTVHFNFKTASADFVGAENYCKLYTINEANDTATYVFDETSAMFKLHLKEVKKGRAGLKGNSSKIFKSLKLLHLENLDQYVLYWQERIILFDNKLKVIEHIKCPKSETTFANGYYLADYNMKTISMNFGSLRQDLRKKTDSLLPNELFENSKKSGEKKFVNLTFLSGAGSSYLFVDGYEIETHMVKY
jgi:hypothetical protein